MKQSTLEKTASPIRRKRRYLSMVLCLIVTISSVACYSDNAMAQMVGENAYIKGRNVEIGIDGRGGFEGVNTLVSRPPVGMHYRSNSNFFGFVANVTSDDWRTFDGDFFTPGTPENGWGVTLLSPYVRYSNNCHNIPGATIDGRVVEYSEENDCITVRWEGVLRRGVIGVKVTKLIVLRNPDRFYTTTVIFENVGSASSPTMYFYRTVDPDNNQRLNSIYETRNTVVQQPGISLCNIAQVSATQDSPRRSYLSLAAAGSNWRAGYAPDFPYRDGFEMWSGSNLTHVQAVGRSAIVDGAIFLSYKLDPLRVGVTETVKYVTILNEDEARNALASIVYLQYPGSTRTAPRSVCSQDIDVVQLCSGDAAELGVTTGSASSDVVLGDFTWQWSPEAGIEYLDAARTRVRVRPSTTTTYTIRGIPRTSCALPFNDAVRVVVRPVPALPSLRNISVCAGATVNAIDLSASDGSRVEWVNSNPSIGLANAGVGSIGSFVAVNETSVPQTAVVVATPVLNGCVGQPQSFSVTVFPQPAIQVEPAEKSLCAGASVTLSATGGISYRWTPANGLSVVDARAVVATPSATTTYTVVATDENGCSGTASVTLNVLPLPIIQSRLSEQCVGEVVEFPALMQVSGSTIAGYRWRGETTEAERMIVSDRRDAPLRVRADEAGTYRFICAVTDVNDCGAEAVQTIVVHPMPAVSNTISNPVYTCLEDVPPTITIGDGINVVGEPPLSVVWSDLSGGNTITGSVSSIVTTVSTKQTRTYRLTVTSRNGCTTSEDVVVSVNPSPDANPGDPVTLCLCSATVASLGKASVCGIGPFVYTWRTGTSILQVSDDVEFNVAPRSTTTYTLTVVDVATGRTNSSDVTVTVSACPVVDIAPVTFCSSEKQIMVEPFIQANATDELVYRWSPNDGTLSDVTVRNPMLTLPDDNTNTTYTLVVTNQHGCEGRGELKVNASRTMTLSLTSDIEAECPRNICRGTVVTLRSSLEGGTPDIRYEWADLGGRGRILSDRNRSTITVEPEETTEFECKATDANGCVASERIRICVDPVPNPNAGPDLAICPGESATGVALPATCGKPPFTYRWSPTVGVSNATILNPVFSPATTTQYTLTVTDDDGLGVSNSDEMVVEVHPLPVLQLGEDIVKCRGSEPNTILARVPDGREGEYRFRWFDGTQELGQSALLDISAIDQSTTLRCEVTDANNCVLTKTVSVIINPTPALSIPSVVVVCPCQQATIGGNATDGVPPYSYAWTDADGSPALDIDNPSSATPTVTPTQDRDYLVTVTDARGCSTTVTQSVLLHRPQVSVGLSLPTVEVQAQQIDAVSIPAVVTNYPQQPVCPPRSLRFSVSYDSWLFDPRPTIAGLATLEENTRNGRRRTLSFVVSPLPRLAESDTVVTITGKALMGEPGFTNLELTNVSWDCANIETTNVNGLLTLDSLCNAPNGISRLLQFDALPSIVSIVPNPANESTGVTIGRYYGEAVRISLNTAEGSVVQVHEWSAADIHPTAQQFESTTITLPTSALPQGVYHVVMQVESTVLSRRLLIIR